MSKKTSMFLKAAFLAGGFGLLATEAFCGGTISGSIHTDIAKNKEDVVVYLKGAFGPAAPRTVVVEQHHMTFIPRVTAIPVGSTVVFTNHDKIHHNVFSVSEAKKFNIDSYDPGLPKRVTFEKSGTVNLLCNVHPEMSAWVVITDNKYAAVSDKDGEFSIHNVPAGTYVIKAWSERLKPEGLTKVTVSDGKTSHVDITLGD
jgi:plastocyanin